MRHFLCLCLHHFTDVLITPDFCFTFARAQDIMRGRDVGLPSYVDARAMMGLSVPTTFAEITSDSQAVVLLQTAYEGRLAEVDAWVGGLVEDTVPGGVVGGLFRAIIHQQFTATRAGDRFWFENTAVSGFTAAEITVRWGSIDRICQCSVLMHVKSWSQVSWRTASSFAGRPR